MSQPSKLALPTPSALSDPSRTIPRGQHNIPRFLLKLYEIVNDPANESLTKWSEAGDSFYIYNQERFAREVLGKWFKHQNFSSFVRQLNLYGFRKISALQQGLLRMDNEGETIQFAHPHFHRGQPDLLALIQRKRHPPSHAQAEDNAVSLYQRSLSHEGKVQNQAVDMRAIVEGINSIRRQQQAIAADLTALKQSNDALWKEAIEARGRHAKHEDTINRILKFLAGLFGRAIHRSPDQSHSEGDPAPSRLLMIGDGREMHGEGGDYFDHDVDGITDAGSRSHTPLSFASERFAAVDTPGASIGSPAPTIAELQESISKSPSKPPLSFPEVRQQQQVMTSTPSGLQLPSLPVNAASNVPSSNTAALQPQVPNPEAMWQATLQQIMTSPSHFQRVMQAFTTAQPRRTSADQGSDALGLFSSVNPIPQQQLAYPAAALSAPTEQLTLPSPAHLVASASPSGPQETALSDNAQRSNKTYHHATEIDADMDALQSNINSLICEMGLDPDNIAFPTVAHSPPGGASPSSVGGIDLGASDFSFDQWLHEITNADLANPSTSKKPLPGSSGTGNPPEGDFSAMLDIPMLEGPRPAPLAAASGAAPLGSPTGVKRKVNVVEVSDIPPQDAPSAKRKR